MVEIVSLSTQLITGGTAPTLPNVVWEGAVNTGDKLTYGWASAVRDAGVTRTDFDAAVRDTLSGQYVFNPNQLYTSVNTALEWTADRPRAVKLELNGGGFPANSSHGYTLGYHAEFIPGAANYCAYGTEIQPNVQFVYYLTPGLLDVWLGALGLPWLAPFLTAAWFTRLDVADLCGTGPPPFPPIDLSTFTSSFSTVMDIVRCIAWPNVCRCKAGAPAPIPFPQPNPSQPPNLPPALTFGCSNADVCSALVQMQRQLAAIAQSIGVNLELTTLLQRYRLPFAYIVGALHSGLTDTGSFSIPRLIGMKIDVTERPAGVIVLPGNPAYEKDLGWLSVSDPDGMIQEIRLAREQITWFPELMSTATRFNYFLMPGVTVRASELEAEV